MIEKKKNRSLAVALIFLATGFWGFSFAITKALWAHQEFLVGHPISSWFLASYSLGWRFSVAGLILTAFVLKSFRSFTGSEVYQGLGLAIFGIGGLIFQMDALHYTSASVSAFLTQFYCVLIPLVKCVRLKKRPNAPLLLSGVFVIAGVSLLSGLDIRSWKLGRGEFETIIASIIFAGQILWLERPRFSQDRQLHATWVMFVVTGVVMFAMAAMLPDRTHVWEIIATPQAASLLGFLTLFCTLLTFTIMVLFQPQIDATEAGLIYCTEPIFASVVALFLPGLLAVWLNSNYENEHLNVNLVAGGSLITIANIILLSRRGKFYSS